jgi:type 1 glutamine amidotransferase
MKRALVFWGGWEGHEPEQVADFCRELLEGEGFEVRVENGTKCLLAYEVSSFDLVVPVITMSTIEPDELQSVVKAVRESGTGIGGCHGGMCDAFRNESEWQFMTGGQWVAHPGDNGVTYTVNFDRTKEHPITAGLNDFEVTSEQYYLHTDPGNLVLATTQFPAPGVDGPHVQNPCAMPQVWVRTYGAGRVFYCALGHVRAVLEAETPKELMRRGLVWAAR